MNQRAWAAAAVLVLMMLPRAGDGQGRPAAPGDSGGVRATVVPGAQYRAGAFTRAVLGSGWRDVWVTPVRVPVLDLSSAAGGLKFVERGGAFQSITVHLDEENGWREWRFRSVDKFPMQGMPAAIKGTAVGAIIRHQISALFPAAPILVQPLLQAIGVLHVEPALYVMEDSPRLGALRDTVAGMLGTFELKGNEAPDDEPGFGGSRKIKGSDEFIEDLRSSRAHRLDEREFLAARLIDLLINDPDRTESNHDWARFGEKDRYTWRPIPRDRDWAFMDASGLLNKLVVRPAFPKMVEFGPRYQLKGLLSASHPLDRKLLQRLNAEDFHEVALRVQRAVSDSVIARVVAALPAEWRNETPAADRLGSTLRARRDQLPDVAMKFYRDLASDVDVYGTDEAERAEIVRHDDGRVTVTITGRETPQIAEARREDGSIVTTSDGSLERSGDGDVYFLRTFTPAETKEIRVYLGGGDDLAMVRGAPSGAIVVRVIGEKGDDAITDSAGGGGTSLYDADGANQLVTARDTRVSTKPWNAPIRASGFRFGDTWRPDWGGGAGWAPAIDYHAGAGLILGIGPRFKSYGFRRLPYHWKAGANLLVGTENGRAALTADVDYRAENSPLSFTLEARASQLEAIRFFGYGNDTPAASRELALVEQTVIAAEPSVVWRIGWRAREGLPNAMRGADSVQTGALRPLVGELRLGSPVSWIDPEPRAGAPLATTGALGAQSFGLAGVKLGLELNRTDRDAVPTAGWNMRAAAAGYPPIMGLDDSFSTVSASAVGYVPLLSAGRGPHVAMRAGGAMATGNVPVQLAPTIGGRSSVRGYPWRRFAGDAAANAGAELRVPVGTVNVLVRSQLGVFALADAGRVWFDGQSDGGWHTGVGGGFWLSSLGKVVSVAYARGESHRFYFKTGMSY